MEFTTVLTPAYEERRLSLQKHFPAGHRFLVAVEQLCRDEPRFHLAVGQDVDLYVMTRFVCGIRLEKLRTRRPQLTFSPWPMTTLKAGTVEDSGILFRRDLTRTVVAHGGFHHWAEKQNDHVEVAVRGDVPDAFFDAMVELFRALPDQLPAPPPPDGEPPVNPAA
jgi:hypothetical protein